MLGVVPASGGLACVCVCVWVGGVRSHLQNHCRNVARNCEQKFPLRVPLTSIPDPLERQEVYCYNSGFDTTDLLLQT